MTRRTRTLVATPDPDGDWTLNLADFGGDEDAYAQALADWHAAREGRTTTEGE